MLILKILSVTANLWQSNN